MDNRVLVAYATKAGSTAEVAAQIGEILSGRNFSVDVQPVTAVTDITPYRAVVMGSAIRVAKLLPEAMSFLDKFQADLRLKPFHTFIVCMTLKDDNAENREIVSAYLDPVRALLQPAGEGMFAGAMKYSKLKWNERLIIKFLKVGEGDFRRWDQINAWAGGLVL
jgi:menaquinone-dependent protoporphyrinogen oxidase